MHIVWSFRSLTTWSSVPGTLLTDPQENCQGTHGINHISPEVPWTLNKTFWKDPFTGAINITATFCDIWEFHRFVAFTELPIPIYMSIWGGDETSCWSSKGTWSWDWGFTWPGGQWLGLDYKGVNDFWTYHLFFQGSSIDFVICIVSSS